MQAPSLTYAATARCPYSDYCSLTPPTPQQEQCTSRRCEESAAPGLHGQELRHMNRIVTLRLTAGQLRSPRPAASWRQKDIRWHPTHAHAHTHGHTTQHTATQHNTTQYNTAQHSTTQHNAAPTHAHPHTHNHCQGGAMKISRHVWPTHQTLA